MFDDRFVFLVEGHRDRIETHRPDAFVFQEPPTPQCFASFAESFLLGGGDAVERALVGTGSTCTNFDDDDHVIEVGEEIDLGATDVQVTSEDGISLEHQVVCRGVFGARACDLTMVRRSRLDRWRWRTFGRGERLVICGASGGFVRRGQVRLPVGG